MKTSFELGRLRRRNWTRTRGWKKKASRVLEKEKQHKGGGGNSASKKPEGFRKGGEVSGTSTSKQFPARWVKRVKGRWNNFSTKSRARELKKAGVLLPVGKPVSANGLENKVEPTTILSISRQSRKASDVTRNTKAEL